MIAKIEIRKVVPDDLRTINMYNQKSLRLGKEIFVLSSEDETKIEGSIILSKNTNTNLLKELLEAEMLAVAIENEELEKFIEDDM